MRGIPGTPKYGAGCPINRSDGVVVLRGPSRNQDPADPREKRFDERIRLAWHLQLVQLLVARVSRTYGLQDPQKDLGTGGSAFGWLEMTVLCKISAKPLGEIAKEHPGCPDSAQLQQLH